MSRNWNEYNPNTLTRNNWRASLVPAAAVIPAPIAYAKVVAVKKLVVGSRVRWCQERWKGNRKSRIRRAAMFGEWSAGMASTSPTHP